MAIEPVTREERFLAAAGGRGVTPPAPITRKEQLLQGIIDAVQSGGATPDVIEAAVTKYLDANPVKPGATTEQAAQIEQNKNDIADLQTEVDELKESGGNGSGENVTQGGLSAAAKAALMAVVESIAVFTVDNPQALIDNLRNALYDAPVASISAVYTQTRTVYASDDLDVLRDDLVVTATYTDGSAAVRTDYTLSGTLSAGTSAITATLDGKTATFEVTVTAARIPATGITLSSESISITTGEPVQLTATLEPADSTDTVVWASSEEAVATVSQDGTVTPVASGSCTITATAGDVSAECAVKVAMPLSGYNYGNPFDLYSADDPTTLGKTDEELKGGFYRCSYNAWSQAMNDGSYANYNAIFLWPMSAGKYYLRTVNRSTLPSNKFMVFGNSDIVVNPNKPLVILDSGTDADTGVTVTKRSSFDWVDANGIARSGACHLGEPLDGPGISHDGPAVIVYEIDVPEGVFVFWSAMAGSDTEWPRTNEWYPIDELYTIFRDDPSGNILQIATEAEA